MADIYNSFNSLAQNIVGSGLRTVINKYNSLSTGNVRSFMTSGGQNIINAVGLDRATAGFLTPVLSQGVMSTTGLFSKIVTDQITLSDLPLYMNYNNNNTIINHALPNYQNNSILQQNGSAAAALQSLAGEPENTRLFTQQSVIAAEINVLIDATRESLVKDTNTVANSTNNAIIKQLQSKFSPQTPDVSDNEATTKTRSYAMDLSEFFPKYHFLYIVKFNMNSDYVDVPTTFAFLVKKFDRPDIQVHSETINFYNFRSPVQTKTEFAPMNMSFHDDSHGELLKFFVSYIRKICPLTNQNTPSSYETNGLAFDGKLTSSFRISSANVTSVISSIELYHVYDYGSTADKYTFQRPQISKFKLSDLDMADGTNASEIVMEFMYENVYIENNIDGSIINELSSSSCTMNLVHSGDSSNVLSSLGSGVSSLLSTGNIPGLDKQYSASLVASNILSNEPALPTIPALSSQTAFLNIESVLSNRNNNSSTAMAINSNAQNILASATNNSLSNFW